MKAILSMALVLGVCGLAGTADDKAADAVGTWKCEYEIGGQAGTSTLKIKKDGDILAATMSWPEQEGDEGQGSEADRRYVNVLRRAEVVRDG